MSYTPDEQLLRDRIQAHIEIANELIAAMNARICNPEEWNEAHLDELGEFMQDIVSMNIRLRKLQRSTR